MLALARNTRILASLYVVSSSLALQIPYTSAPCVPHRPCTATLATRPQLTCRRLNQAPAMREGEKASYLSSSVAAWAELAKQNPAAVRV